MVCAVCLSIFLWICDMARLLHGTFVSWWYLPRIWPSVTDMQHYYHARYPTDDWHLAYMFLLVYFSVEVCLEGVIPHSVSTRRDPWARVYAPLTPAPPSRENQIEQGWPGVAFWYCSRSQIVPISSAHARYKVLEFEFPSRSEIVPVCCSHIRLPLCLLFFSCFHRPTPSLYKCINNYLYKEGGGAMETGKW